MSFQQKKQALGVIETLLNSISEKSAEANTEPGSIGGPSSHPSAKVDDKTQDAPTGARYSENEADNKSEPNRGDLAVEQTGDGGTQDSVQTNIGMTSKTTGEDPANETSSTKAVKEDSDTSHPARTDNSELDGRKYSSYEEKLAALLKRAADLGSSVAAAIAVEVEKQSASCATMEATDKPTNAPKAEPEADPAAKQKEEGSEKDKMASVVGEDLAELFASAAIPAEDAVALKQASEEYLGQVIKAAEYRAMLAAEFVAAYAAEKRAMEEESEESDDDDDDDEEKKPESAPAPTAAPPAPDQAAAPAPAGGGLGEEDIMALLGSGEDMGATGAMDGMDQTDMEDPSAGLGGEDDMVVLDEALSQLGITPEQLQQLLGEQAAAPAEPKLASAKKKASANKATTKEAQKKAAFQRKVANTKNMIRELIGRSRG